MSDKTNLPRCGPEMQLVAIREDREHRWVDYVNLARLRMAETAIRETIFATEAADAERTRMLRSIARLISILEQADDLPLGADPVL